MASIRELHQQLVSKQRSAVEIATEAIASSGSNRSCVVAIYDTRSPSGEY